MKLILMMVIAIVFISPAGAESIANSDGYLERQKAFQQKVQRLMKNYRALSESYRPRLYLEQSRDGAIKSALQRSTDRYIDALSAPFAGGHGFVLFRRGPAYRQQYSRLRHSRHWQRKILNRPLRYQSPLARPRLHGNWGLRLGQ